MFAASLAKAEIQKWIEIQILDYIWWNAMHVNQQGYIYEVSYSLLIFEF